MIKIMRALSITYILDPYWRTYLNLLPGIEKWGPRLHGEETPLSVPSSLHKYFRIFLTPKDKTHPLLGQKGGQLDLAQNKGPFSLHSGIQGSL
jgi:hypothetical protein